MKKLVFSLMVVLFGTAGLMAQTTTKKACSKEKTACCASKAAGTASTAAVATENPKVLSMARSMADKDESISTRQCAESGKVSFYKKSTCETSGKISYNEVEFDAEQNTFVNKSPKDIGTADNGKMINVLNATSVEEGTEVRAEVGAKKSCDKGAAKASCSKKEAAKCCSKDSKKKAGAQE